MIGNASALELAVIAVGLAGCLIALLNVRYYLANLADVRQRHINGFRGRLARRHLRNELVRVYKLTCFVAIGLIAALTPPAVHTENQRTAIIASVLLVSVELAMAYQSIADRIDLRRERRLVEAEDAAWHRPGHELN